MKLAAALDSNLSIQQFISEVLRARGVKSLPEVADEFAEDRRWDQYAAYRPKRWFGRTRGAKKKNSPQPEANEYQ